MLGFHVCFEAFYKRIWTGRKFPRPKYNESVVNVWHDRDIEPRTYKNCPPPQFACFICQSDNRVPKDDSNFTEEWLFKCPLKKLRM